MFIIYHIGSLYKVAQGCTIQIYTVGFSLE